MQALVVDRAARKKVPDVIRVARERGLLVTRAGEDAVRLLPPLTCSETEVDEALEILGVALGAIEGSKERGVQG